MSNKRHILVVDDDQFMLFTLEQFLLIKGFEVDTARDGKEAQEKVLKNRYDLLITDINMPRATGFELAQFIKDKNIGLPIILISASPEAEDYAKAKSLGDIALLTKLIPLNELYDTIEKTIDIRKKEDV